MASFDWSQADGNLTHKIHMREKERCDKRAKTGKIIFLVLGILLLIVMGVIHYAYSQYRITGRPSFETLRFEYQLEIWGYGHLNINSSSNSKIDFNKYLEDESIELEPRYTEQLEQLYTEKDVLKSQYIDLYEQWKSSVSEKTKSDKKSYNGLIIDSDSIMSLLASPDAKKLEEQIMALNEQIYNKEREAVASQRKKIVNSLFLKMIPLMVGSVAVSIVGFAGYPVYVRRCYEWFVDKLLCICNARCVGKRIIRRRYYHSYYLTFKMKSGETCETKVSSSLLDQVSADDTVLLVSVGNSGSVDRIYPDLA